MILGLLRGDIEFAKLLDERVDFSVMEMSERPVSPANLAVLRPFCRKRGQRPDTTLDMVPNQ